MTHLPHLIATNVLKRRTALGITQAGLAVSAGTTVETIARLERVLRGRKSANANPCIETLERIANALGCDVVALLTMKQPKRGRDELDLVLTGTSPRLRKRIAGVVKALKRDAELA